MRILAIGVLSSEPTLFVNPNAHALLHPPLLRSRPGHFDDLWSVPLDSRGVAPPKSPSSVLNGTTSNEVYFPLVRTLSPSTPGTTSYGLGEGASSLQANAPPLPSPSLSSTLARVLPGRRRRSTATDLQTAADGTTLSQVRSRDSDEGRRRSWASAFGRNRSGSTGNTLERTISSTQPVALASPGLAAVGEVSPLHEDQSPPLAIETVSSTTDPSHSNSSSDAARPYPTIRKPVPAPAYELYPNFTPPCGESDKVVTDTRALHPEVEDDYNGHLWASDETTHRDYVRMVEWSEQRGRRERWVGPMMYGTSPLSLSIPACC